MWRDFKMPREEAERLYDSLLQAFLKEMLAAMDALPEQKLISHELEENGSVCAIGAVGKARGIDMSRIDPEDRETVAHKFGIAGALTAEIVYTNDEYYRYETPEERFTRMRKWIESLIVSPETQKA